MSAFVWKFVPNFIYLILYRKIYTRRRKDFLIVLNVTTEPVLDVLKTFIFGPLSAGTEDQIWKF